MKKDKDNNRILIANRIQTPDGTILWSRFTHDCVFYEDANGERYMLDGGNDLYRRVSDNVEKAKDVSIYDDADWETQRQYRLRGTFDQDGHRVWVPLAKLSNDHLNAILEYNKENDQLLGNLPILKEMAYRKKNDIEIPEHDYTFEGVQPIKPTSEYVCPRCGSRNVTCHSGMYVDRFECEDCHWDWR